MSQTKKAAAPVFEIGDGGFDAPEVRLAAAAPARARASVSIVQGVNLSDRPKLVLVVGRGKNGKTTACRWMADRAMAADRSLLMGDLDPTNATFSTWFQNVQRPKDVDDAGGSVRWLQSVIDFSLRKRVTAMVDFGSVTSPLRRLVDDMPDLTATVASEGAAVVLLYFLGPQEDDLSPVVALEERGFQPEATALVLNEAALDLGVHREAGFARLQRHSAYRAAIGRGALPVFMPRLQVASMIEARRLHFTDARDGAVDKDGNATVGPLDRSRVRSWLAAMEENFAGVSTWLP